MDRVQIWFDPQLTGDALFDDVIRNRINNCALFLALNSNGYNESEYCQQEVIWFNDHATKDHGVSIGERMRFLNVRLYDIPHDQWPHQLGRTSGFTFFDESIDEPLESHDQRFKAQLNELVKTIHGSLSGFKELVETRPIEDGPKSPESSDGPSIFVATVADSLQLDRKRLVAELERQGISVNKKLPPPYDGEQHHQAVSSALGESVLSVHMLDDLPGPEIEEDVASNRVEETYPRKQIQLALEKGKSPLVWVPDSLDIDAISDENNEQKKLLQNLRDRNRHSTGQFSRAPVTEIPAMIIEQLQQLSAKQNLDIMSSAKAPPAILLDTHTRDQHLTLEISQYLSSNGILPYINPLEDDPKSNLQLLKERLGQVCASIIFYGQVSDEWVHARYTEIYKLIIEECYPVKVIAFYLASANGDAADIALVPNQIILDNRNKFSPDTLIPLLDSLGLEYGK